MPHRFLALAICILLWGLAPIASGNLLVNGNFEDLSGWLANWENPNGIPGWTYWEDYPYDGDGVANGAPWAQHAEAAICVGVRTGPDYAVDGIVDLQLGWQWGTWRAFMYQEVAVTPGSWYRIEGYGCLAGQGGYGGTTFWVVDGAWQGVESPGEGRDWGANGPVGGVDIFEIYNVYDEEWHWFGSYFQAGGDTVTIAIESWAEQDGALRLSGYDALVLEVIPEPGTLALLATGLVCARALRRSSKWKEG